ncbi:MAG: DedA family protein [Sulfuriferula multivorans]|uniref:DedA family protein n=1 Tax=Sulfuriferula multivorans TaxID=1559896 RepID=A0A7C9P4X5_9PROT|nr:DedA family protein [Sulfuriferula multivorans]
MFDWALFGSALLSSTLFPGGSEVLLLYRLHQGSDPVASVLTATAGNVLGSLITYAMGRFGREAVQRRSEKADQHIARAERWFKRFGRPSLLLAWLPIVGDPLCLIVCVLHVGVSVFLVLVTVGKLARYAALAWVM